MEPLNHAQNKQQQSPNKVPPLPRDPRGSLEVFNPSTYSTRPTNPVFRSPPSWQSWVNQPRSSSPDRQQEVKQVIVPEEEPEEEEAPIKPIANEGEIATTWMALQDPVITPNRQLNSADDHQEARKSPREAAAAAKSRHHLPGEVGAAAQRAAEWGLVLKTDDETGKLQGVKVRTSGDEQNSKGGTSRRDSGNSIRSSGDLSDDGTGKIL